MSRTRLSHTLRSAGAVAALTASLTLAGCGFDAQTLQPYTPAQGLNVDVKDGPKVRDLLVIANTSGKGRLSASLLSTTSDALTAVSGTALKPNGSDGSALTVGAANIRLPAGQLVVLTGPGTSAVSISGADLKPGLAARLELRFASGAIQDIVVPVMDAANPIYTAAAPELS